jgi:uncharacterized membrane protein YdjX (TVP38/TMEM64 family)
MPLPVAPTSQKKIPWIKLAIVLGVLVIGAILVARGVDIRGLLNQAMDAIRARGPVAFFIALALLPGVGFPVLAFGLTAGPAFSEQLGMPTVVALVLLAVTFNFILTYALARRALRPVLEKLMRRCGYNLPQVEAGDATDLVVILRLTPGIPFFVQNYLAGLAEVNFRKYLLLSCLMVWPTHAATVLFGAAIMEGKGRVAIMAAMGLVAIGAIAHLVRKHYARKRKPSA